MLQAVAPSLTLKTNKRQAQAQATSASEQKG